MASRSTYESNVGLFFILSGLLLQLVSTRKNNPAYLGLSAIFYALSTYAYITTKLISFPLLLLTGIFLKSSKKRLGLAIAVYLILALPQFLLLTTSSGNNRVGSLNPGSESFVFRQAARYLSYYSPRNLFFNPDADPGKSFPELSVYYPWMVVPYLLGIYLFATSKNGDKKYILLSILFIAPIPAAIAKDPFATIRSLPLSFPLSIIISLGIERLLTIPRMKYLIPFILMASIFSLYRSVFVLFPHERYQEWGYGYKQLTEFVSRYPDTPVLLEDSRGVYYIEFLFFNKIILTPQPLPDYYNHIRFDPSHRFDRFTTRSIDWADDPKKDQIIIATPLAINAIQAEDHWLKKISSIIGPDGKLVFNIYRTQPEIILAEN